MYKSTTQLCNTTLLDFVGANYIIRDRIYNILKLISNSFDIVWTLPLNEKGGEYTSLSEEEFMYFSNRKSTFYSKLSGEKQGEENKYYYRYEKGNSVFIDMNDPEAFVTEKYQISIPYENLVDLIHLDYLIQYKDNHSILTCRSLKTGAELWKVDVGELGPYEDMKGQMVKGEVSEVFALGDTVIAKVKASVLVGYSVEGGVQRWLHRFGSGNAYLLALYEGVFHVFADLYYEIDGASGQILAKKPYRELFAEADFKDYWLTAPAVSDKYIAISSHYDTAILLINRSTFTVEQRIALEGCKSGIPLSNAPRLYGNRLYQLDGDGTLHIFEEKE